MLSELKETLQDHFALQRKLVQYRHVDDLSEAYDSLIVLDCYELLEMLYAEADDVDCDLISKILKFLYLISSNSEENVLEERRPASVTSVRNEVSFLLGGNTYKEEFDVLYRRNFRAATSERSPLVGISNLAWQNGFVKLMEMLNELLPVVSCYTSQTFDSEDLNLNQSFTIDKVVKEDYIILDFVIDALEVLQDGLKCDTLDELDCRINDYYYSSMSDIEIQVDIKSCFSIEALFDAAKKGEAPLHSVIFNMLLRRRTSLEERDKEAQVQKEFGFFFDLETEASRIREEIRTLQNESLSELMKHSEVFKKVRELQQTNDMRVKPEKQTSPTETNEATFDKMKHEKIEKDSNGAAIDETNSTVKTRKERNTREAKISK